MANDEVLISRAQSGDEQAFADLMRAYYTFVYKIVIGIVDNPHDAEEVVQDTFLNAYRGLAQYEEQTKFRSWLAKIARNRALNWLRERRMDTVSIDEVGEHELQTPNTLDDQLIRDEQRELISRAMETLSQKDREIAHSYYLDGASYDELTRTHGLSYKAIAFRLSRAKQRLAKRLQYLLTGFSVPPATTLKQIYSGGLTAMKIGTAPKITAGAIGIVALANRGKVRDLYDLGEQLLIISTDRISAFDVVLPNGIPYKGQILTGLSEFWFDYTKSIVDNHIITTDVSQYPDVLQADTEVPKGRSMLVRKANRIDIECVVRGYIAGSAWSEYKQDGTVCGEKLPAGLTESERLPELIFTPATKAEQGEHDENISIAEMEETIGKALSDKIIQTSFALFEAASEHAEKAGIILCDTKFEFGQIDGQLILIDEVFTPDSSRFWPKDEYKPGSSPPSFDKQYVRDYLSDIGWNKEPPAPELPAEVIRQTSEKYLEAYRLIVGRELL